MSVTPVKSYSQIIKGFQKTITELDLLIESKIKKNSKESRIKVGLEAKISESNDRVTENYQEITRAQNFKNKLADFIGE